MFKHTKIVATIGPSCDQPEILLGMIKAGLNVARLNFSHGTHEWHTKVFHALREAEKKSGEILTVMQDVQGPKIRIGDMPEDGIEIKEGDKIIFNTGVEKYTKKEIPLDFPELHKFAKPGERILISDGKIDTKITKVEGKKLHAVVVEGGILYSNKGVNVPDTHLQISPLTKKDREDIKLGVKLGVDFIAVSFIYCAKDILDVKFLIKKYEEALKIPASHPPIKVIAKIERQEAVKNIKEILEVVDGIMVARGDLGVETPAAELPLVQKSLIDECNAMAKPVIVATQMLDSMQSTRRPTRAEVSDVANAVIDHADALMLSNETAVGKFPVHTIQTMTDIILATERSVYDDLNLEPNYKKGSSVDVAVTEISNFLAEEVGAKLILAASLTGETGRLISHLRPSLPIVVATSTERVWRQMNLSWGVSAFVLPQCASIEELIERSVSYIKENKIAKKGDRMIVVAGEPVGHAGNVNLVEVREIK